MAAADYEPTSESCLGRPANGTTYDGPSVPPRWGRYLWFPFAVSSQRIDLIGAKLRLV